ncbi:hypothetical protein EKK58_12075 [Candidatus Dependentiae bacterium]|nr:MAG: hypothetical protein EKK58_12075 [Candidatus Dependentiae bacterium]
MSLYATKWEQISAEEYRSIYDKGLIVYSSYTNPDGDDGISCSPQMMTTWGDDERQLIKSYATRTREQAEDKTKWEWDYKYYKAIEWEVHE